jgi:dUTP pyrophosphatase
MVIKFKLLTQTARLPVMNHETDAGIDIFSDEGFEIPPKERHMFSTGVCWEPYFDAREQTVSYLFKMYMQIQGRSGLASKNGIAVLGGVIDQDYRGEIKIILVNTGDDWVKVNKGDKIAQGVVHFTPHVQIKMDDTISQTARGGNGFGSSGS